MSTNGESMTTSTSTLSPSDNEDSSLDENQNQDTVQRMPEFTVDLTPNEGISSPTPSRFTVQKMEFPEFEVTQDAKHSFGYHLTTSNCHTYTPSLLPHCYETRCDSNVQNLTPDFFTPPKFVHRRAKSHTLSECERRYLAKFAANFPKKLSALESATSSPDPNNNGYNSALKLSTAVSSEGRLTWQLVLCALVCFFTNSLPSGFNMGVVNTPEAIFKSFFNATLTKNAIPPQEEVIELYWSVAVSSLLIGAFLGCIYTGAMANAFGRRNSLFLNGLIGLMGVSLCWASAYFPSVYIFMIGRFVAGLHTGVASSLVPMYLMEIAPKNLQTPLGIVHVSGMNGGQMVAQILGLGSIFGTPNHWPLLFVSNAIFIMVGLAGLMLLEESPVFLFVLRGEEKKAITSMQNIRKQNFNELADDILEMRQAQKDQQAYPVSLFHSLRNSPAFVKSLLIVCFLHAGQQFIGINAIFFYSTKTFRSVGFSDITSQYSSIGCTALNTITASVITIPLIRRFSCRALLKASATGTLLILILLPAAMSYKDSFEFLNYATIGLILTFVFIFALGLGPIPYMIGGELFDRSTMAIGMSIGCFVNWLCNFTIAITFPLVALAIQEYVFIIFAIFNAFLLAFIYWKVPEK